jgi:hypothetical protein
MLRDFGWYYDLSARMPENVSHNLGRQRQGLGSRLGFKTQPIGTILVHIAVVVVFGIFLPLWLGIQFLDPVTIAAYSCLGVLFAAPAAAQAFADQRPHSMSDALAGIAIAALYGEAMAIVILLAGFMTIFMTHARVLLTPDFVGLGEAAALGLSGSLALASIAAVTGLLLPKGAARMVLRIIFLGLLVLFFFRSRWLPDVEISGTVLCLAVAVVAIVALRRLIANPESAS